MGIWQYIYVILFVLFFKPENMSAQSRHPTGIAFSKEINQDISPYSPKVFYFPIDRHMLMRDYADNKAMLDALDTLLNDSSVTNNIDTIEIFGACSPVASEEYNRSLALRRARSLKTYIRWKHPDTAEAHPIVMRAIGIDHEGYRALKASGRRLTEKQIWDLLQYTSVRLKMQDGTLIPAAEGSPIENIVQNHPEIITRTVCDTIQVVVHDTVYLPGAMPQPRPRIIALKNNLLYDAVLLPNLAVEIPFAGRWSAVVYGNWSWWDTKAPKYWSHRIQWAGVGLKYWWGNQTETPLHGYFAGIYVSGGTYDLRLFTQSLDDMGYLSNWSFSTGLTAGYAFPLSERWSMEFSIDAGYLGGDYYEYNRSRCADCYPERAVGKRRYFGPAGAAINLVYRIGGDWYTGRNNKNEKESGIDD